MKRISVIGSGFAGLSAAAYLAKYGYDVTLIEKNMELGGRARMFEVDGFRFDMGPSWYWMPEVFEKFYNDFGYTQSDFYELDRLDPSYRVYFGRQDFTDVPADYQELRAYFESREKGAAKNLDLFLEHAQYKYEVGMKEFVVKPSLSILEFMDIRILKSAWKLNMFSSISKEVRKLFKDPHLIQILEFPVLFLGATPQETPALYSLMNYADLKLGTWYPQGGMNKIIQAIKSIAAEQGVKFVTNEEIIDVDVRNNSIVNLHTSQKHTRDTEVVVAACDYHHFETSVLPPIYKSYDDSYWNTRTMAPSSLLFYLGVDKKLDGIKHHTLFFDEDFDLHAQEIYKDIKWPTAPLFYMCAPSVTDDSIAPEGCENLFLLMPLAAGIEDSHELREEYFSLLLDRLQAVANISLRDHIVYKKSFCVNDFISEYNSFKGNAYGLANTLRQTAFMKPKMRSKRIKNLFYAGQLTTPGPGVPPSIVSGKVVADLISKSI